MGNPLPFTTGSQDGFNGGTFQDAMELMTGEKKNMSSFTNHWVS